MENFKIKILNKEHLSEVLTILHKLGYYWNIVNTGVANNYILTYNDGSMGYARAHRRFEEDSNIEVTLERLIELYETQEDTQKSFVKEIDWEQRRYEIAKSLIASTTTNVNNDVENLQELIKDEKDFDLYCCKLSFRIINQLKNV